MTVQYTSQLGVAYRADLESLLFFNPGQDRVYHAIMSVIGKYGAPSIVTDGDHLRVRLEGGRESQTLFALVGEESSLRLAGIMIYTRVDTATLLILHLAVARAFSAHGRHHGQQIALRLIATLRGLARRIRGTRVLQLIYGGEQPRNIQVIREGALS